MRISDWSSDVCSSDLDRLGIHVLDAIGSFCEPLGLKQDTVTWDLPVPDEARAWAREQWPGDGIPTLLISPCSSHALRNWRSDRYAAVADHAAARGWRSEEHTSELQSLMRISYAVLCLKTKKQYTSTDHPTTDKPHY